MWWHEDMDELEEQGRLPTWEMFRRVYPYVRPHRKVFLIAFVLVLISILATVCQPLVIMHLFDTAIPAGEYEGIVRAALVFLGLMLAMGMATMGTYILVGWAGVMSVNAIKRDLFSHFFRLGVLWLEKSPVGVLVSRIESDSQRLVMLTSTMMVQILTSLGILIGAFVIVGLIIDGRLFLIAASIIPLMIGGTFFIFWKLRPRFRKERSLYGKLTGLLAEVMPAARFLQAVGRSRWAWKRVERENEDYKRFTVKLYFMEYGLFHGLGFLEVVMTVLAIWLGSRWVAEGSLTVGGLIAFALLVAQIYWPIIQLSEQLGEIQRAGGAADRIFKALDLEPPIGVPADPVPTPARPGGFRFDGVGFEYDPGKPVLTDVSFELNEGETVALVGPTGGGKSTLVGLICRFMDPTAGRITLDGRDLRDYDPHALRRLFGLVLQDLYLFPASVTDNLRAFRPEVSREQILSAARTAGLHEIIARRESAYDSVLESRGKDMSYGQRQLMAFARALAVDPPVLILDEATSSVDPGTELKIQETLDRLVANRTALIVAHRLSTVKTADRILLVAGGRIVESGSHDELVAAGGDYAHLVALQMGEVNRAGKSA